MSYRNPKPTPSYGITPQTFASATVDKFNRESLSQIEALQKGVGAVTARAPAEDEAPADTPLFALRTAAYSRPSTTAAVALVSGNPDVDVPGSGVPLGTLYRGELVDVQFHLDPVTIVGPVYLRLSLLADAGQGSPEQVVRELVAHTDGALASRALLAGVVFDVGRRVYHARLRLQVGSAGGTLLVPVQAAMLQRIAIHTPQRRP